MPGSWWQTLFGRERTGGDSRLAAALGRGRLPWPLQSRASCRGSPPLGGAPEAGVSQRRCEKLEIHLRHLVEVSRLTEYLLRELRCDNWYVACRHEHQLIIRMTRGPETPYAVCYECQPEVEKAIYHGSHAWALSLIPLGGEGALSAEQVAKIRAALAGLPPGDEPAGS